MKTWRYLCAQLAVVGSAFLLVAVEARADLIYSNFDPTSTWNDSWYVSNNQPVAEWERLVRYTPSSTFLLNSLLLPVSTPAALGNYAPIPPAGTIFGTGMRVTVYTDANGLPGTAIETMNMPNSLVTNAGLFVPAAPPVHVAFSGTTTFNAGQFYWIGVAETDQSVVQWNNTGIMGDPTTVKIRLVGSSTFFNSNMGAAAFQVHGTPIPGPSGVLLLAMALAGLSGRRPRSASSE